MQYLINRMQQEIERNKNVLSPAELEEYQTALRVYQNLAETARE